MREMIKLFAVITIFAAVSGGVLASIRAATIERIENQELQFVKGPAIARIMEGCSNDPMTDRFKLKDGDTERLFFVGAFEGKRNVVAFESFGTGYGGKMGVIVAVNLDDDKIVGVGVTTHAETPGIGSRLKDDPSIFCDQFKGRPLIGEFKVKSAGGDVDAVSGATLSSSGASAAMSSLAEIYKRMKSEIKNKLLS
jgi:electron transport complex protein RnfG